MPETPNPAEIAAARTWEEVQQCLDERKHFLLEAGAGAGKTYSLVQALNYLIKKCGADFLRRNQRIGCITYTKVATREIEARTDSNPVIFSGTIHAFFWSMMRDFQPFLRRELPTIAGWPERIAEAGEIGNRPIEYNLGHPKIHEDRILLGHNDILVLATRLLAVEKFRQILNSRYPVIFIDEYQDTDKGIAEALRTHVLANEKPLIGLFGDHLQKIYGTGCGRIEHANLKVINKGANFRSTQTIVNFLNMVRPELPQVARDSTSLGTVSVYHTNNWAGQRRAGAQWKDDLPSEVAHSFLEQLTLQLTRAGWDFTVAKTKILMLTHNVLAAEQGYAELANIFEYNDAFLEKKDVHIAFLVDIVEPVCRAYSQKRFGEMFSRLNSQVPPISSHEDKKAWSQCLDRLLELRGNGTIGDVMDFLKEAKRIQVPESITQREIELTRRPEPDGAESADSVETLRRLRGISYKQVIALHDFIEEQTPFATKHGVKGAEFENVLVVFGRGWNLYNFNQFLEWAGSTIPADKQDTFDRNRNLFYVVCSRPIQRLALLFTQRLSAEAIATLGRWAGTQNIHELPRT